MIKNVEEIAKRIDSAMRKAHLNPENDQDFQAFKTLFTQTMDGEGAPQTIDLDKVAARAAQVREYQKAQAGESTPHDMAAIGYQANYENEAIKTSDGIEVSRNAFNMFKPAYPQATEDKPLSPYELAKMGYQKHAEESEG